LKEVNDSFMNWYREIGTLVDSLGHREFPRILVDQLQRIVACDLATIFVNQRRSRPLLVFDNFSTDGSKRGLANYLDHTYVLNPFYNAHLQGIEEGVHRIGDLAPDGFFESELARSRNVTLSDSEEIGYLTRGWPREMEEVDIAVSLGENVTGEIAIYRAVSQGGFEDSQLESLRRVHPVIAACFRQYWANHGQHFKQGGDGGASWADQAFDRFGCEMLTGREQEVIHLVLRGHSSESIGYNLGISITTVKTHRKNAYEKLGIATQAELLSLFLQSMRNGAGPTTPHPPLEG
jgi:DNA-binding CsgD family transcriptional regulator